MKASSKCRLFLISLFIAFSSSIIAAPLNEVVSDTVITAKIKSKLAADSLTQAKNISVETNNGIVTLRGAASSEMEAAKSVEIAEGTRGVKKVETNELKVINVEQPLTDTYITAKVKGIWVKYNLTHKGPSLPINDIKVETLNGIVNLTGYAKSSWQVKKLVELAKSVDGVSKVNSQIVLKK